MTCALETRSETSKKRKMWEANEIKSQRKIVGKTKIDIIRIQEIRESCGIQTMNEWVERRGRELDQYVTRMDAERFVRISRNNVPSEDHLQDALKEDGATQLLIETGGIAFKEEEEEEEAKEE